MLTSTGYGKTTSSEESHWVVVFIRLGRTFSVEVNCSCMCELPLLK